jgi:hypothetical protein
MTDMQDPIAVPKRSLTRQIGRCLLIGFGILLAVATLAVVLNATLLRMFDNVQQWRTDHYWPLLAWRLMLYTLLAVAWFKLKARLTESERLKSRNRLLKIEILVALLVLLIELSKVLLQPGGAQ